MDQSEFPTTTNRLPLENTFRCLPQSVTNRISACGGSATALVSIAVTPQ